MFQSLDKPAARRETLAYAKKELLRLRFLDPACGSGTFLVLIISRMRQLAEMLDIPLRDVLNVLQRNVVGIDLNPLAAIAARTNFLLALGELLTLPGRGTITIPVYLADSIVPPGPGRTLEDAGTFPIPTTAGRFRVPEAFGTRQRLDALADTLDDAVQAERPVQAFLGAMRAKVDLSDDTWENTERPLAALYKQLLDLHKHGLNGVWARIIRNAFAPLFIGQFDYVVGNPPWVNWESLPDNYREETEPLWQKYELFTHKGLRARLGGAKDDISVLMTYTAADRYLKKGGKLGFVITQSIFKTKGGGEGFRRGLRGVTVPLKVLHVDDMVDLKPFETASNRTSVVILEKGSITDYPVSYTVWRRRVGEVPPVYGSLEDITATTLRLQYKAQPVNIEDSSSPWITARPQALSALKKVLGKSEYQARSGCCTWANAVYWVEVLGDHGTDLLNVRNLSEEGRLEIEPTQALMEKDIVFPLLRGRDITRWHARPSANIIIPQLPAKPNKGYPEKEFGKTYPKAFGFLRRFENILRARSGYRKYLEPLGEPFYALYNIGEYTFAKYKVGWAREDAFLRCSVIEGDYSQGTVVIPDQTVQFLSFQNKENAHFLCALMNSAPCVFVAKSYATDITTHVVTVIQLPDFDQMDGLHHRLVTLSQRAHALATEIYTQGTSDAAREKAQAKLREVEEEVDERAAELWGLTQAELKEIKKSLEELG